ncbi:unnamed protein product [Rhizophagus irregularis]|nr:unnamed protein product [Rhizophagus irregularis]
MPEAIVPAFLYKKPISSGVFCILTQNNTRSWIDLYNQHLLEINADPADLIGPAVDNLEKTDGSEDEEEDITQEQYEP